MTATTDDHTTAPVDDEETGSGRRRRLSVAAGAAVLIAATATSALLGSQLWQQHQLDAAGRQAQAAATSYAEVLTGIDSSKVDENFTRVLDGATGEFKDMYTQSSVKLRQLLIDNRASAHGMVLESAVKSASTDTVEVLLFVDQSVSNAANPQPRLDRSRIKMTMKKVDGRWLASKVELP
ncbi:Mce protein [Mycolicibacterium fortuitum]|uniref:Mce protein n=1 Tax=Mycolicibacterium fortuitum TaxID=1766 RepID=UPI00096E8078|nr:Mce protein [Mycolicibacterium fortuitum]OMC00577.1 Mce protein [Mycolicibacterium fortuitum]